MLRCGKSIRVIGKNKKVLCTEHSSFRRMDLMIYK